MFTFVMQIKNIYKPQSQAVMKSKSILRKQAMKLEKLVEEASVMASRAECRYVANDTFDTWSEAMGAEDNLSRLEMMLEGVRFQLRNYDFLKKCEEEENEERELRLYHIL